jgi:hypothetical protein
LGHHLNKAVKARSGDRDHRFSVGYPSFKEEGVVFWAGNIRPVLPEIKRDLEKI